MTARGVISPGLLALLTMDDDRLRCALRRWWAWKKPEGERGVPQVGVTLELCAAAADSGVGMGDATCGKESNGLRSRPSAVALGVSWSMEVDGQNLSMVADLRTAEWREEKEADFEWDADPR